MEIDLELQVNGTNGFDEENEPPAENHISANGEEPVTGKSESDTGGGDAEKKKSSSEHKSSHRDNDHHKSSHRDKDRHHSSSHKSSHKDKDGHHHSSSSHKSSHRDKDGHRHSSSSHSKSSHRDKDKDGHHHSSSHSSSHKSSHRDKDGHRHSSSHGSSHKSSHKDGHSSSKHSSSSSKHHSGSSSDKHRSHKSSHHHSEKKPEVKQEIKEEPMLEMGAGDLKLEPMSPIKESVKVESFSPVKAEVKAEESEDDVPLSARKEALKPKKEVSYAEDDEDDQPLSARVEKAKVKVESKKRKQEDDGDFAPIKKKKKKDTPKTAKKEIPSPTKGKKKGAKGEGTEEKWKWWEEEPKQDGVKWTFLEHKGPVFAPPYERLPDYVKFYYNGEVMKLEAAAEEVAGFYGKMLSHDYTTRTVFNTNFFKDWKKTMTLKEKSIITDLSKCNFKEMYDYFTQKSEERKAMSKLEKKQIKEENAAIVEEYGFCVMDDHKEKIGNFRIEPPGLFRGRGEHPKQGMLKTRTQPEDIIVNCSKDSDAPAPPEHHRWKEVRHDNQVTWLCSWNENIQGSTKYIMLAPTSKLKGAKDWQKYETARKLHKVVDKIRAQYREDFKSKEMRIRQRAVALYFIDKLALRAGNEKDGDETADTVGCCSLRVEHIKLNEELDGQEYVVEFDFLGKDSIRYYNKVPVEKRVFKNLQLFTDNKNPADDLFDRLNTAIMNKHLNSLMDGLTAKVFRTYNASRTLGEQLNLLTNEDDNVPAKMLSYNRANRAVAVLCNHQRAAPKNFSKQMENLQTKIDAKKDAIRECKREVKQAKADLKAMKTAKAKVTLERKKKAVQRLEEQLVKLEVQATDKDENKEIALGTSKLNYLDPRISVAWCKKWDVPIEKVYNKTQREKFAWAIDMTEEEYDFCNIEED